VTRPGHDPARFIHPRGGDTSACSVLRRRSRQLSGSRSLGGSARSYLTLRTLATVLQSWDDHPHHRLTTPPQHGSLSLGWKRWPVHQCCACDVSIRPVGSIRASVGFSSCTWVPRRLRIPNSRSPTHASGGAGPALRLANPPTACTVGDAGAAARAARARGAESVMLVPIMSGLLAANFWTRGAQMLRFCATEVMSRDLGS
jgi:hypothetical protein